MRRHGAFLSQKAKLKKEISVYTVNNYEEFR
jgi:hypothetical protein